MLYTSPITKCFHHCVVILCVGYKHASAVLCLINYLLLLCCCLLYYIRVLYVLQCRYMRAYRPGLALVALYDPWLFVTLAVSSPACVSRECRICFAGYHRRRRLVLDRALVAEGGGDAVVARSRSSLHVLLAIVWYKFIKHLYI